MSKLLAMMMRKQQYMDLSVVGSPTINNGVVSGFSVSDYLNISQPFVLSQNTNAEINLKINIPEMKAGNCILATDISNGIYLYIDSNSKIRLYLGDGSSWIISNVSGNYTLLANTDYYINIRIINNIITISIKTDNGNWTTDIQENMNLSNEQSYTINLGARTTTQYFNGSIDINNSYIVIDGTKYIFTLS